MRYRYGFLFGTYKVVNVCSILLNNQNVYKLEFGICSQKAHAIVHSKQKQVLHMLYPKHKSVDYIKPKRQNRYRLLYFFGYTYRNKKKI